MSESEHQVTTLAVHIGRQRPQWGAERVAGVSASLVELAGEYGSIQVERCNRELDAEDISREAAIEKKIGELTADVGVSSILGGDPRGYTVKLLFSHKPYNSWGGEECGWGIG